MTEEYTFKIKREDSDAVRKLELLLLGRALNFLNLEELNLEEDNNQPVSIEALVKRECSDLARYQLVHHKTKKIYGFNSPKTLLCPMPDTSDQDWQSLWEEISDHTDPNGNWKKSEKWGNSGGKARNCIANWVTRLDGKIPENDCWNILAEKFSSEKGDSGAFGIAEWLPISDGKNSKKEIPLPVCGDSVIPPKKNGLEDERPSYDNQEIRKLIEGFDECGGFEFVEDLPVPGLDRPQSMMWRDHLDKLQEMHKIFAWGKEGSQIWIKTEFDEEPIHIKDLRVIDLETVTIKTCIPLKQKPLGFDIKKEDRLKFPDLPLLPEYICLAKASPDREKPLIYENWDGMEGELAYELKEEINKVEWTLCLAGRPKPEKKSVTYTEPVGAHWMIWPNFKTKKEEEHQWKAYYIYENSERKLEARPILDRGGELSEPKRRPKDSLGYARAVEFDPKKGIHTGGPPVALCAYDHDKKENVGLYKVKLSPFSKPKPGKDESEWKIAIDFGTSHTVAAVGKGNKKEPVSIDLKSEFSNADTSGNPKLSLHISENWPEESKKSEMQLDLWRPTYLEGNQSASELPSSLWSLEDIGSVETSKMEEEWEPMTHYVIIHKKLNRKDSHRHTISGFKWEMSHQKFKGQETWLQKKYLGMAIEIFVAKIARDKERLPRTIRFTFTYPLRGMSSGDTDTYKKTVAAVLEHSTRDLGFQVPPKEELLYSESHAAAGTIGTGNPFEVRLVADLGGGTLDIFISTCDSDDEENKESRFKEVADSTRLGADLLLEYMADEREKYLPQEKERGNWGEDKETCLENLRAWMRLEGANRLFNQTTGYESDLGLYGFQNGKKDRKRSEASRALIDRYFYLIIDFLARSLVAYVVRDVWENEDIKEHERKRIKLFVRLQGNGWRLCYDPPQYRSIQEKIEEDVKNRAKKLWVEVGGINVNGQIPDPEIWCPDEGSSEPKLEPIRNAVDKGKDPSKIKTYNFPLSEVSLERKGKKEITKKWFQPLPFTSVEDPKNTILIVHRFDPKLCFHPPDDLDELLIEGLEQRFMRKIKESLAEEKSVYRKTLNAPIAAIIWENVFRSPKFRED